MGRKTLRRRATSITLSCLPQYALDRRSFDPPTTYFPVQGWKRPVIQNLFDINRRSLN